MSLVILPTKPLRRAGLENKLLCEQILKANRKSILIWNTYIVDTHSHVFFYHFLDDHP